MSTPQYCEFRTPWGKPDFVMLPEGMDEVTTGMACEDKSGLGLAELGMREGINGEHAGSRKEKQRRSPERQREKC